MDLKEQILAALKKCGPAAPSIVADKAGVEAGVAGYHLRALKDAGTIKAQGKGRGIRYAMPDQAFDDAPPQGSKKPRKARKRGKSKHARGPRARAAEASPFIPAIDVERRLVLVNGGAPQVFNPQQTEAIATLLLNHFEV